MAEKMNSKFLEVSLDISWISLVYKLKTVAGKQYTTSSSTPFTFSNFCSQQWYKNSKHTTSASCCTT